MQPRLGSQITIKIPLIDIVRYRWMALWIATMLVLPLSASTGEVQLNGHTFTLPDGFDIQLVAAPPLINRPITADFDDQGRLYVSDSSGSNDKVQQQLETKPHRIMRLEDSNGDGVYDTSTVFADHMMFPEGTMWHDGSLYVSAPPSIWKLTDTDGDGTADHREEWFQGKTLTGCANDLHGPHRSPDGWVYWCKGAFAEQTHMVHNATWTTKASHIFRCRPDGTGLEPVMTGGMDNPVDVVFLSNGERFFTTTFLVNPGNGQRDGILHDIYGGVYGKEQGALEGHARTGELMPVLSHMGAAAPCGLVCYESGAFGGGYVDNLFACQFNMHKVSRHVLQSIGASYHSQDSDFVVSSNLDFHPTDIGEDADGSLVIVDTGGWYKLCCPTSQLWKPDILGGVYRVFKKDTKRDSDPRGRGIDWSAVKSPELIQLVSDDRPAVRRRAVRELAGRAKAEDISKVLPALPQPNKTAPPEQRPRPLTAAERNTQVRLLWALTNVDHDGARQYIRQSLAAFTDETVRQVALHSVSLRQDRLASTELREILASGSPMNRRAAAEALGRLGDSSAIPLLLKASAKIEALERPGIGDGRTSDGNSTPTFDRALEHSIIYALIELRDADATKKGLSSDNPQTRRAALIAVDQMLGGGLNSNQVTPLLASNDPTLKETSHWIISHHPEWGDQLAEYFVARLSSVVETAKNVAPPNRNDVSPVISPDDELEQQLVRFNSNTKIQSTLSECVLNETTMTPAGRKLALRVMAKSKPKEVPALWLDALALLIDRHVKRLASPSAGSGTESSSATAVSILAVAVSTARELPPPKQPHQELNAALRAVAANESIAASVRLDAMAAVAGGMTELNESQFQLLLASLLPDNAVALRAAAADALAQARLSPVQLDRLAETIKSVGPLELDRLLVPFERANDEQIGLKLVASLKQALALSSLRMDSLQLRLAKYSPAVQQGVVELVMIINAEAAHQKQRIEELLPSTAQGDIRRGQAVFNSTKAACFACHRFGYLGGNDGPDLTRIGSIRTDRDLLESILYPSLSFVRSYEPVIIVGTDGRVLNGLIRNETTNEIVLTTGPNQVVHLAKTEIEEMRPSTVSVMPAGLDKQLTAQELADLVSFLRNAK